MNLGLICISLIFLFFLPTISFVFASPENWVEVARWHGEAFPKLAKFQTQTFAISHTEWKILLLTTAQGSFDFESIVVIEVYEQGNPERTDLIYKTSYFDQSYTNYVHKKGTFYLNATIANCEEYYVIVYQDVDSVPELSPIVILPLFMAISTIAVVYYRKHIKIAEVQ